MLVINDITFRVFLFIMIHFGLLAKVVDVETAFLYRELDNDIHMKQTLGMKDVENGGCITFK